MNPKWLHHQIEELRNHLTDFKKVRSNSEANYRELLRLIIDPKQRSSLMEKHLLYVNRQDQSIAKLERMHAEAVDHLQRLEESDL